MVCVAPGWGRIDESNSCNTVTSSDGRCENDEIAFNLRIGPLIKELIGRGEEAAGVKYNPIFARISLPEARGTRTWCIGVGHYSMQHLSLLFLYSCNMPGSHYTILHSGVFKKPRLI